MALPTIPNVYRIALNWRESVTGQTAANVIHVQKAGTTPGAVLAAVDAAAVTGMMETATSGARVVELVATPLDGGGAGADLATANSAWTGASAADFVPNVAVVVTFKTAQRGRSYRGRIFLPFTSEALISEGSVTSATAASVVTNWQDFVTSLGAAGLTLGIASYKHSTFAAITSVTCLQGVGTQRRRQQRVRYP